MNDLLLEDEIDVEDLEIEWDTVSSIFDNVGHSRENVMQLSLAVKILKL